MEQTTEQVTIERELEIAASPEMVWAFLVDPEKALRWMGVSARLDPRPGECCVVLAAAKSADSKNNEY